MSIRIAACQYETELGNKEKNVELSLGWLDKAGNANVDLVALPELITTGYNAGEAMLDLAEPIPGPVTDLWSQKAQKYGFYLVAGLCRRDPDILSQIYNSAVLINPDGEIGGLYSKVILPLYLHTFVNEQEGSAVVEEAELFRRGDSLPVFKTALGTIGIQICQDAVYPEHTRVQSFKGAQLIVQLLNGPAVTTRHEADITPLTTRVHAFDNGVFILLANKCGIETYSSGGRTMSMTFHGESHVADPYGNFVAKAASEKEDLLITEINLEEVKKAQWQTKFLRDWRPELLDPLCRRGRSLGKD